MTAAIYAPTTGMRVQGAEQLAEADWVVMEAVDAALAKLGQAPVAKVAKKAKVAELPAQRALLALVAFHQAHAVARGVYAPGL